MDKKLTIDLLSRKDDISVEEVRCLNRFKNYTDEQILEIISTIKAYTKIIYNLYSKPIENGRIFALTNETEKQKAA